MPPLDGRPDPLGQLGLRAAWFCEQCGTNREQLGDEDVAPIRECPRCRQAACPNCWNIVGAACLRCVPFSLPLVADQAPQVAETTVAETPVADAQAPALDSAEEPPRGVGRLRRGRAAAPAAGASVIAPPERAVEWPDRSVEWQVRPSQTSIDRESPSSDESAAPPIPVARVEASARPVVRPHAGRSRTASMAGFAVVLVALIGVAGLSLTALGRLPGAGQSGGRLEQSAGSDQPATTGGAPTPLGAGFASDDPATVPIDPDAPGSDTGGDPPGITTPGGPDPAPGATDKTSPTSGASASPNGGASPEPTASPTTAPTAGPTATPTPGPTATPTADPTPTPTPDPTPDPTRADARSHPRPDANANARPDARSDPDTRGHRLILSRFGGPPGTLRGCQQ